MVFVLKARTLDAFEKKVLEYTKKQIAEDNLKSFYDLLVDKMIEWDMSDADLYKKACVDRKAFH